MEYGVRYLLRLKFLVGDPRHFTPCCGLEPTQDFADLLFADFLHHTKNASPEEYLNNARIRKKCFKVM